MACGQLVASRWLKLCTHWQTEPSADGSRTACGSFVDSFKLSTNDPRTKISFHVRGRSANMENQIKRNGACLRASYRPADTHRTWSTRADQTLWWFGQKLTRVGSSRARPVVSNKMIRRKGLRLVEAHFSVYYKIEIKMNNLNCETFLRLKNEFHIHSKMWIDYDSMSISNVLRSFARRGLK